MKKIIFWIDSNFLNFFVAKQIKEKSEHEIHAIFEITDNPKKFFKQQKMVDFKTCWYYHENIKNLKSDVDYEFLENKEKEYGINFMKLMLNDRILYNFNEFYNFSSNEVFKILELEIKFFEKIVDQIKPDYLIMDAAFLRPGYLFSLICKKKKMKNLMVVPTRVYNKCMITDHWNNLPLKKNTNSIKKQIKEKNSVDENSYSKQLANLEKNFLNSKINMIKAILKFLFSNNSNSISHYTYYGRTKIKVIQKYFFDLIRVKIRKRFIDKKFSFDENIDSKFIYLPLHLEQEHSTLIMAPFYTDQLNFISNVQKSIPVGYKLVIKEHPAMFTRSWHSIEFYKKILNMPNVIMVHPSVNSSNLLKKCDLVVTIGGSVSFEAGYFDKSAITFVETAWSFLPHIYLVKNIEKLSETIDLAIKTKHDNNEFLSYVTYLQENSFNFNPYEISQQLQNVFHYGGYYVDVKLYEDELEQFETENNNAISLLTNEYLSKINED